MNTVLADTAGALVRSCTMMEKLPLVGAAAGVVRLTPGVARAAWSDPRSQDRSWPSVTVRARTSRWGAAKNPATASAFIVVTSSAFFTPLTKRGTRPLSRIAMWY